MSARWEYLTVRWHHQRLNPPDPNEESAEWSHKYDVEIRRPGDTEGEVVATDIWIWQKGMSEYKQTQKTHIGVFGLLNELGADGWECFSTQTMGSTVGPRDGHETASSPVDVYYYFKRERDG
jgi:hypothetical protein